MNEIIGKLFLESLKQKKISSCKLTNIQKIQGDASGRQYYRVETTKGSYIVCLQASLPNNASQNDFFEVQKILKDHQICVPTIYDAGLEKGHLLLEDLGDVTLLKKLSSLESIEEEFGIYKNVLDQLLQIHSIGDLKHRVFERSFDVKKLMDEVRFSVLHFVKGALNYSMTKKEEEALISGFDQICKEISAGDYVFTHRDYHSRNIIFYKSNFFVIDFQDARKGVPQYDLASLLDDCYYSIGEETKHRLQRYYFERSPLQTDFSGFIRLYDYTKMQRLFKALGSFGYLGGQKKDIRYLKYIGYGLENLRKTLHKYPELKELRILVSQIYYGS